MDTTKLKKFAQFARRSLIAQVSAKLESVLTEGAAAQREHPEAMKKLVAAIASDGKSQVIERVAYIWFNRFSALRFMDVNDLSPVRVVSPLVGQFQPEILAEAKAGNIDEYRVPEKVRAQVTSLLDGRTPSADAQAEVYRLLLVATCNDWHTAMPFLFERIDDFTELLLPEDLLSNSSILAYLREAMTPDACEDVEVIGWLYQFYISEKKDDVFTGLKKNLKITAEKIPAATQLFTPHWIVRYLIENSLGRLWMLNRPGSNLAAQMDYYIEPEEPETDFLRIASAEEIKVCDPACGSGHMLTYAFDLLYAIYEEEGYEAAEIPEKILMHNLYGIEIDERAGALAAFALVMKAAGKRKRFLRRPVQPNICVLMNVSFRDEEIPDYIKVVGRDLFTDGLLETMRQFGEAKNFGSLIVPKLKYVDQIRTLIAGKDLQGNLFIRDMHERMQAALRMADYLSQKYHVVVANPPYMGGKGMNETLKAWVESEYHRSSQDLFSAFIERANLMTLNKGMSCLITMDSWASAPGFKEFRENMLQSSPLLSVAHLGTRAFDTISGEVVSTIAFVRQNSELTRHHKPLFSDLRAGKSEAEKKAMFQDPVTRYRRLTQLDFMRIEGAPIAYWLPEPFIARLQSAKKLADVARPRSGLTTSDNDRYLRHWWEVAEFNGRLTDINYEDGIFDKWVPVNGGSTFRRWYGSNNYVLFWKNHGISIKNNAAATMANSEFQFKPGLTWSKISGSNLSVRRTESGFMFTAVGLKAFPIFSDMNQVCGLLNSRLVEYMVPIFSSNLTILSGDIAKYPFISVPGAVDANVEALCGLSREDWDAYETSWDFTSPPLLTPSWRADTLEGSYSHLRNHWRRMTEDTLRLEEENNRIFIDAYGLADELAPEVQVSEITLTCNPAYRYGRSKSDAELEEALRADTMREFISYAVGCMFGRYSLDAFGLILVNQGEGLEDYLGRIPHPRFAPDADNIIPMLDGDWFADDICERFRRFLRVTFGDARFQENLVFIEGALGKKGRARPLRDYFVKDFFTDHVKRYKKRPIYWLFSSPKGTFNALIYMHRYRPETVNILLNEYLRPFRSKLEAHKIAQERLSISTDATQAQRTTALKEIQTVTKQISEIDAWERDVIYPLATRRIEIEPDDGVKANYPKFGSALKPIKGLEEAAD